MPNIAISKYVVDNDTVVLEAEEIASDHLVTGYQVWLKDMRDDEPKCRAYTCAKLRWWNLLSNKNLEAWEKYSKPKIFKRDGKTYSYLQTRYEGKHGTSSAWHPETVYFDYARFLQDHPNWIDEKTRSYEDRRAQNEHHSKPRYQQGGNF